MTKGNNHGKNEKKNKGAGRGRPNGARGRACFDFANAEEVWVKLDEEIAEVKAAATSGDAEGVAEEMGDLLLTVTSLARKLGVNAEEALYHATEKFLDRFERLEREVTARGLVMDDLSMAELDAIWDQIKHQ